MTSTSRLPAPRGRGSLFHQAGRLARQAATILRAQAPALLVVASIVVLGPTLLVVFGQSWLESHDETAGNLTVAVLAAVAAAVLSTVGSTFLAGLVDRLAGHHLDGHPFHGLADTFRTLPYGRLILADLAVSVIVVIATGLLVVPGLVAYTLLAVVGPIIIVEDRGVRAAIARSMRLVRPHFWLVFLSVTSLTVLESAVEETLDHLGVTHHLIGEIIVTFAIGVLVGTFAALIKVCAAYELLVRELEAEGSST